MEITYQSGAPQKLWSASLLPVYLLWGEEERLKEEAVAAISQEAVSPEWMDFDYELLDMANCKVDQIISAATQVPFGGLRRLVVVRGIELLREKGKQSDIDRLAGSVNSLPVSSCLVMIAGSQEEEGRRKTAVSPKLDTAVKNRGALVVFRAMNERSAAAWVEQRLRASGKSIQTDALEKLTNIAGRDLLTLENEIEKLTQYTGDRELITVRDVEVLTAESPDDVIFAVLEAVTRRQIDKAMLLLGELHRNEPRPQAVAGKLLALLTRQFRLLWQAKTLSELRIRPSDVRSLPIEVAAELPSDGSIVQVAFKAGELFAIARNWSWEELRQAMELLILCDIANKGDVTGEAVQFGSDPVRNLQTLFLLITSI